AGAGLARHGTGRELPAGRASDLRRTHDRNRVAVQAELDLVESGEDHERGYAERRRDMVGQALAREHALGAADDVEQLPDVRLAAQVDHALETGLLRRAGLHPGDPRRTAHDLLVALEDPFAVRRVGGGAG